MPTQSTIDSSKPTHTMAARLRMPPEIWLETLDLFWGVRDPNELRGLWNDTRLVSKQFKSTIEHIFREEHVPKTKLVLAICE